MAISLCVEDCLDGASNFSAWKVRVVLLLKENKLWDIVESTTTKLVTVPTDATTKVAYDKKNIKARRILLDAIKDHVIPHITWKENVYEMWDSLTKLYKSSNENRNMVLREKFKSIKMVKDDNIWPLTLLGEHRLDTIWGMWGRRWRMESQFGKP